MPWAGRQLSEQAQELPSLLTPADVHLLTDDGGCLPVHASVLELSSQLLADSLKEDRAQRTPGQPLLLHVPTASMEQVLQLLKMAYSSKRISLVKERDLDTLKGLAEVATLLQCKDIAALADVDGRWHWSGSLACWIVPAPSPPSCGRTSWGCRA